MASRLGGLAAVRLAEVGARAGDARPLPPDGVAVLLKALLVHGASWGEMPNALLEEFAELVSTKGKRVRFSPRHDLLSRFLGYGSVSRDMALLNTGSRVTAVATGVLADGEAHSDQLPLPPSIPATRARRRLTTTLARNSPINVRHRAYRQAHLWLKRRGEGAEDRDLLNEKATRRETVERAASENEQAIAVGGDDEADFTVNCRQAAGRLDAPVRYGLAVTLEVAVGRGVDLHAEISEPDSGARAGGAGIRPCSAADGLTGPSEGEGRRKRFRDDLTKLAAADLYPPGRRPPPGNATGGAFANVKLGARRI